jgi:hypothetical protein
MLARAKVLSGGPVGMIGGLTVVVLGAIAFALPAPPIEPGTSGGFVIGHEWVIGVAAERRARTEGYAFAVVDLTTADLRPGAYWREHTDEIRKRRLPVWGWVKIDRTEASREHARAVLRSVGLAGLYVYGPGAVEEAESLGRVRAGIPIIPVLVRGATPPAEGPYGLPLDADAFAGKLGDRVIPVLRAASMSSLDVRLARDARGDETYLVAQIPVLD